MTGQVQPPREPQDPVAPPGSLTFNTVITKLKAGRQVFSNTITDPDLEAAKEGCVGQDFMWIEMGLPFLGASKSGPEACHQFVDLVQGVQDRFGHPVHVQDQPSP